MPSKTTPSLDSRPRQWTDHVEEILAVIRQNRGLTVREVAEEVGIYKSSFHLTLNRKTEDA